jgi:hypothetical protein
VKVKFSDYDGPTGMFIATGKEILPLDTPAGQIALIGGAVQSGIGDQKTAEQLQTEIDAAIVKAKRPAKRQRA